MVLYFKAAAPLLAGVAAAGRAAGASGPGSGGVPRPRAGPLSQVLPGARRVSAFAAAREGRAGTPAARSQNRRF